MIRKLQRRFIRIAVIALTIAMVLVVFIVNMANWMSVRAELADTLLLLEEREAGPTPSFFPAPPEENDAGARNAAEGRGSAEKSLLDGRLFGRNRHYRTILSESGWFMVSFDEDGSPAAVSMHNIDSLEEQDAMALGQKAADSGRENAMIQDYLYHVLEDREGKTRVLFLNCETRMEALRRLAWISAAACLGGILLAFLIVALASRKAVEPSIRNMEQQKQFITNASHELKTPLTVISTNMELLQMEQPGNPWVRSTQKQTAAMRHLVDELVYLSRLEEEHPTLVTESVNLAEELADVAEPFAAMAEFNGHEMEIRSEGDTVLQGDRASLRRLLSTLCDNAVKYTSPGGLIRAETEGDGKNVVIRVSNPVDEPLSREQCEQMFSRFYRVDPSRNKDKKSGFGIGLAIAAAVAEKHGGKIAASMAPDQRLVFTCTLPRNGLKA